MSRLMSLAGLIAGVLTTTKGSWGIRVPRQPIKPSKALHPPPPRSRNDDVQEEVARDVRRRNEALNRRLPKHRRLTTNIKKIR